MTQQTDIHLPIHQRLQWYVDEGILPHAFSLIMRGADLVDYRCFGYTDIRISCSSKTTLTRHYLRFVRLLQK